MVSEGWGMTLSYLGRSILKARTGGQIVNLLNAQGLVDAKSVSLTAGVVCVVSGRKRISGKQETQLVSTSKPLLVAVT
jgi:hypothetical protein